MAIESDSSNEFAYQPNCVASDIGSDDGTSSYLHGTLCPPSIMTMITSSTRENLFKIEASVTSVYNDQIILCNSQKGLDALCQELDHLRHVHLTKLCRTKIDHRLPILLRSHERAEIHDIQARKVYLYDKGWYHRVDNWDHYELPKSLLEIPAQAFEVHLITPQRLVVGQSITLLVCSSMMSGSLRHSSRIIFQGIILDFVD